MKKILVFLIITMGSIALLSSCEGLGEKECFCSHYRDGELKTQMTAPMVQGGCSQLNSSVVVYVEGVPVVHETKCTEMF